MIGPRTEFWWDAISEFDNRNKARERAELTVAPDPGEVRLFRVLPSRLAGRPRRRCPAGVAGGTLRSRSGPVRLAWLDPTPELRLLARRDRGWMRER